MMDAQLQKPSTDSKPAATQEKSVVVPLAAIERQAAAGAAPQAQADSVTPQPGTTAAFGLLKRAQVEEDRNKTVIIARFDGLSGLEGSAKSQRIVVQRQSRAWLMPAGTLQPTVLGPGMYQLGNLPIQGTKKEKDGVNVYNYGVICRVSDMPIFATLVFPDTQAFAERKGVDEDADETEFIALSEPNFRTSDGLLGGARCQVGFKCTDAPLLIQAFGEIKVEKGHVLDDGNEMKPSLPRRLFNWLTGRGEPDFFTNIPPFTVDDLFRLIRLELMGALRAVIGNYDAMNLYKMADNRKNVEDEIKKHLTNTLEKIGMAIESVTAFQFTCPAYEVLLRETAKAEIEKKGVEVVRKKAETASELRKIETDDQKGKISAANDVARHKVDEEKRTKADLDAAGLEELHRRLERDKTQKTHTRDEQLADERQKILLLKEKSQMAIEMQNQMRDAEQKRQLEMMKAYADLPPERLLQVAMIQHPHLAAAFQATQQAKGLQQQIAMLTTFREQLTGAYGKNSDQIQQLMLAAVTQLGGVLQARAGAAFLQDNAKVIPGVQVFTTSTPASPVEPVGPATPQDPQTPG
jgi:hypothetical protein